MNGECVENVGAGSLWSEGASRTEEKLSHNEGGQCCCTLCEKPAQPIPEGEFLGHLAEHARCDLIERIRIARRVALALDGDLSQAHL